MQEQFEEIICYAKGSLKYKWVAIFVAWVFCVGGWTFVMNMPDKYTSKARVQVDTRTMLRPLLKGLAVETDIRAIVGVMKQLMFTQSNLEQIITLSNLDKNAGSSSKREHNKMLLDLKKSIKISGGGRSDFFEISYEGKSPETTKNVVHAVLTIFSEQTQNTASSDSGAAQRFIDEQISEYEIRLRNAEKARENFKRINIGLLPESGKGQISKVQQLRKELNDAKLALSEATSKRDFLSTQMREVLESGEDWSVANLSQNFSSDDEKIEKLRTQRMELLIKYTENHPEVIALDKAIEELEKRKQMAESAKPLVEDWSNAAAMSNPYVQNLKIALNEAEADVASYGMRVKTLQQRIKNTEQQLNARLKVETELMGLNRDYEAIKKNYEQLVQRRELASISEKMDTQVSPLNFKIVDPPNTPLKPSSPNRKLLLTVVLVVGVFAGMGAAIAIYFLSPSIMTTRQLRLVTGLPVLGVVSLLTRRKDKWAKAKEIIKLGAATVGLLIIYFGFMAMELYRNEVYKIYRHII